jgi:flagellar motor switch protein FliG
VSDIKGIEKAAVLLINVGENLASEVMKFLSHREVKEISENIARMDSIPPEVGREVVNEFLANSTRSGLAVQGLEFARSVIEKALGPEKARRVLEQIAKETEGDGIKALAYMEPTVVANMVRAEHPQIIALILTLMPPERASLVLRELPELLKGDVMQRVAVIESIPQAAVNEIEAVIREQVVESEDTQGDMVEGIKVAAEILNQVDSATETSVFEFIEKSSADLAAKIQEKMFVFTDLLEMEDRAMQAILKEVETESLSIALKGADEALREKFFKNMSERAAEMLKEDIETRGPVRVSDVEAAQIAVVSVARRLEQEGKIMRAGKQGDVIA